MPSHQPPGATPGLHREVTDGPAVLRKSARAFPGGHRNGVRGQQGTNGGRVGRVQAGMPGSPAQLKSAPDLQAALMFCRTLIWAKNF